MAISSFTALLLFLLVYTRAKAQTFYFDANGTPQKICFTVSNSEFVITPSQPVAGNYTGNFDMVAADNFMLVPRAGGNSFSFRAIPGRPQSRGQFSLTFTTDDNSTHLIVQYSPEAIYPNEDYFELGSERSEVVAQYYIGEQGSVDVCINVNESLRNVFTVQPALDQSCVSGGRGVVLMSHRNVADTRLYEVVLAAGTCSTAKIKSSPFTLTSIRSTPPPPPGNETTTETESPPESTTSSPGTSIAGIVGGVVGGVLGGVIIVGVCIFILCRCRDKLPKVGCLESGDPVSLTSLSEQPVKNGHHTDGGPGPGRVAGLGNGHIKRKKSKYSRVSFLTPMYTGTTGIQYKELTESLALHHQVQLESFEPNDTLEMIKTLRYREKDHLVYVIWDGSLESLNGHGSHIKSLFKEIESGAFSLDNIFLFQLGNKAKKPLEGPNGHTIFPILASPNESNFSGKLCGDEIFSIVSHKVEEPEVEPQLELDLERHGGSPSSVEQSHPPELVETKNTTSAEASPLISAHNSDVLRVIKEGVKEGVKEGMKEGFKEEVGGLIKDTENKVISALEGAKSSIKTTVTDAVTGAESSIKTTVKDTATGTESRLTKTIINEAGVLHTHIDEVEGDLEDISDSVNKITPTQIDDEDPTP